MASRAEKPQFLQLRANLDISGDEILVKTFPFSLNHLRLWPSTFFFFFPLASNAIPDVGSVGWIERKKTKQNKKQIHKKSRNSCPWYPRMTFQVNIHIFGLTKCTIYWKKCSCFCSCFSLCCYYADFLNLKNYFQ